MRPNRFLFKILANQQDWMVFTRTALICEIAEQLAKTVTCHHKQQLCQSIGELPVCANSQTQKVL